MGEMEDEEEDKDAGREEEDKEEDKEAGGEVICSREEDKEADGKGTGNAASKSSNALRKLRSQSFVISTNTVQSTRSVIPSCSTISERIFPISSFVGAGTRYLCTATLHGSNDTSNILSDEDKPTGMCVFFHHTT